MWVTGLGRKFGATEGRVKVLEGISETNYSEIRRYEVFEMWIIKKEGSELKWSMNPLTDIIIQHVIWKKRLDVVKEGCTECN